jgi:plasmid maintenance system antidote protein VapI
MSTTSTAAAAARNPNGLMDAVMQKLGAKNDAALARGLQVAPPVISKIRHGRLPVGPAMILKCHEIAGLPVPTIRGFIGGAA